MVTLYNPPSFYYTGHHYRYLPPLALAIFARMLKAEGIGAQVIDLERMRVLPEKINLPKGEVVGFTGLTIGAQGIADSIQSLRAKGYKGRIVVGGIHATLKPEEVLRMGADLVVTGESDGNFIELMMGNQTGIVQGERLPIEDIASPDWDACTPDIHKYVGQYKMLHPVAGVGMWQRGCPYNCLFCGNATFNKQKTRYRPPEKIAEEMLDLHNRGIDRVYVYDDEMIGARYPDQWMKNIADLIEPLGMTWATQARCSKRFITLDVLKDMHRAGCRMIFWGVESLSQNVLDAIDKRITYEDVENSLRLSKEAGIKNSLFMMVGSYKETEQDLEITRSNLNKLYKKGLFDYMQVFIAKVYAGSRLEEVAKQEGWYGEEKSATYYRSEEPHPTPWLTGSQIKQWKRNLVQSCPTPSP
jgi:radical SAM superfamily enzyme YgiQ (UPF0313 family)